LDPQGFCGLSRELKGLHFTIDPERLDTLTLKGYVISKRDFLLRLIENPNLLEHETFTELLLAYFHLIEELVPGWSFLPWARTT